jgi:hypothetical protein
MWFEGKISEVNLLDNKLTLSLSNMGSVLVWSSSSCPALTPKSGPVLQVRTHEDGRTFRGQLDGPHRVHLVKKGALGSLVTAAALFPQSQPLCQAAAAGIMYLAGAGREATENVRGVNLRAFHIFKFRIV